MPGAGHGSGEVNVEFRQAEHFLAVIEHGSLVRASSALHLAQPSLSQSIQTLERDLGAPLFHRVGRGLVPTAVGSALVAPARQLLRDVATAQASVAEFSGLHGGHVDIGTTAGLYESRVPALVGELRRTYRSVSVRIREYSSEAAVAAAVRDGSVELGFGFVDPETEDHDLETHSLGSEELCIALPRRIAEEVPDPLPFDQVPDLPVIAVTGGAQGRVAVEGALRRSARRTAIGVVTEHRQATIPLVAAGAGIAWTSQAVVDNIDSSEVVARSMQPPLVLGVAVMHRPGMLSPAARALLETALRGVEHVDSEGAS